jgi:uncharacterized protein YcaQ
MPTSPPPHAERLTRSEARSLAVFAQRLDRRPPKPRNRAAAKALLLATIHHIGCVQLDTISVVARSHETVLWSRIGPYDPALLTELHYPDRELFEYWLHAAAIGPVDLLAPSRHLMAWYGERLGRPGEWGSQQTDLFERLLARLAEHGPLASRDFERPDGPRPAVWEWYGGKPERRALAHLWSRGMVLPLKREGFQRYWDLTERAVPAAAAMPTPSLQASRRIFATRALAALGVTTRGWLADYFRSGGRPHVPLRDAERELAAMETDGMAIRAAIEGLPDAVWLDPALLPRLDRLRGAAADNRSSAGEHAERGAAPLPADAVIPATAPGLAGSGRAAPAPGRGGDDQIATAGAHADALMRGGRVPRRPTLTTLLSPFDNLIWHRGRTEALFDFSYRLESYTPAHARQYGYYTLPILDRGALVGRLDPHLDRRARTLTVRALHLEPGVRPSDRLAASVAAALRDYATFLNATAIDVLTTNPPTFQALMRTALGEPSTPPTAS